MQVRVIKNKKSEQIKEMVKALAVKHKTISSLSQKVSISKCSSMNNMTDLVIWKNLKEGADYVEEIIFENSEIFETLSPRRIELSSSIITTLKASS